MIMVEAGILPLNYARTRNALQLYELTAWGQTVVILYGAVWGDSNELPFPTGRTIRRRFGAGKAASASCMHRNPEPRLRPLPGQTLRKEDARTRGSVPFMRKGHSRILALWFIGAEIFILMVFDSLTQANLYRSGLARRR